jgi:3-hydroxyisobutyrate dehydrogenase-like beta-hydroxyacid dehydrogenase
MADDPTATRSAAAAVAAAVGPARSSSSRANGRSARTISKGIVGFVGLGRMGTAMAANLAAGGIRVVAYVRRPDRFSELKALGLTSTTNIGDLFDCEFVVSMLPNDDAVRQVVFGRDRNGLDGLAAGMVPGALHLSMSTISTTAASQLAAEHARHCQGYVAAPVFGNPDAARARELYIIAAGASRDIDRCRSLFAILGRQTFSVSRDPSAANLIKLAGNVMTATTLEVLGEVISLIRKRGLNPETFIDVLTATMFGGRVHRIYGGKIAAQSYTVAGFVLPLALKDVSLALAEAEREAVPMPSVSIVRDRLLSGIARGYAEFDWTALGLIAAEDAGLQAPLPRSPIKPALAQAGI